MEGVRCQDTPIDEDVQTVGAGVVAAGGDGFEGVLFADEHDFAGGEG